MSAIERAMLGAAMAPLSRRQKARICALARRAWEQAGRPYYDKARVAAGDPLALSASLAFELWRHEQQQLGCGKRHLTACTQADFPLLMAHFLRLIGRAGAADGWLRRALDDPRRQALAALARECARARDVIAHPEDYVASIAWRQYRRRVAECAAEQVWSLVYTLRARCAKRRKEAVHEAVRHSR